MLSPRAAVIAFFVSTFVLLGLVPLAEALLFAGRGGIGVVAARASEATGIPWTSNLLSVVRLALAEPSLWVLLLGSAVPTLAALLVCAVSGQRELRALAGRLVPVLRGVRLAQGLAAYAAILILMPLCLVVVYGLREVLPGPDYARPASVALGPALLLAILTAALLDQGGVLEEIGWRGYATPKLEDYFMSPLGAALLVGVMWGVWHVPRDIVTGVITRLGLFQYLLLYLPSFLMGTLSVSILASFFMCRTGGSVWPGIMIHGLANDAVGLSGMATIEQALTPYHQFTKALPFVALAVMLLLWQGKSLGCRAQPREGASSGHRCP